MIALDDLSISDITVADIDRDDVARILAYWYESPPEYLQSIGVDPARLPGRRKMEEMLALKLARPGPPPTIVAIKVRGASVGVHELTHIEAGVSAVMHAHIWRREHRARGIGAVSYVRAMERFFAEHGFRRILFETPSGNAGANRLKRTLGLAPIGQGTVFLPIMTRPVETTRYQVERADLPRLIERLERVWMPRTRALVSFGAVGPPARRLFGFPYAGGSSVAYRDWPSALPGTDVWAVELPGRGRLFGQPALRRLPEIVDYAVAAIEPRTESPFAVHGHSLGAATALEVTRALVQRGRPPLCLIVTGAAAPHLPSRRARPLHSLPRWELLDALEDLETLPEALRARPDVLDAFLPTIRADMESRETWRAEIGDIQVPIHAFSGRDDQHVSFEELKEWRRHTSGPFSARQLEGGHFFIKSREDVFLPLVRQILESHAATGGVDREHHLPG